MSRVNQNSCRVCLGEGLKPIFSSQTAESAKGLQYSRLAEKLRFVSMLPISDQDTLPQMLCYNCIVQLNMAYSFKNIVVETNLYLERVAIESGTLTPATSSVTDDDRASVVSMARPPEIQSPCIAPAAPLSIISSIGSPQRPRDTLVAEVNSVSCFSDSDDMPLLMPNQIKTEPLDLDQQEEEDREFITRSALEAIMSSQRLPKKRGRPPSAQKGANKTAQTQKKSRQSEPIRNTVESPQISLFKRPMVSVHKLIPQNNQKDKEYLESVMQQHRDNAAVPESPRTLRKRQELAESDLLPLLPKDSEKQTKSPVKGKYRRKHDMNQTLQEPHEITKNRLRTRRTST